MQDPESFIGHPDSITLSPKRTNRFQDPFPLSFLWSVNEIWKICHMTLLHCRLEDKEKGRIPYLVQFGSQLPFRLSSDRLNLKRTLEQGIKEGTITKKNTA
jgi:hypothetical protein